MFPDHPAIAATAVTAVMIAISATASTSAPNRQRFIYKVSRLHEQPGPLIVLRNAAPGEAEPASCTDPRASRIGDGASHIAFAAAL